MNRLTLSLHIPIELPKIRNTEICRISRLDLHTTSAKPAIDCKKAVACSSLGGLGSYVRACVRDRDREALGVWRPPSGGAENTYASLTHA